MQGITIRISRRKLRGLKILLTGILLISVIFVLDARIRPMITTVSDYQTKLAVTTSINEAVMQVISQEDPMYGSIIALTYGGNGEVTSISTNMVAINRLKAEITERISQRLLADSNKDIAIPIGTLFGGQVFSGRGPSITFKILSLGYIDTEIYNEFKSVGINQTLHQIMLSVHAMVNGVSYIYTVETDVQTSICIAETVIVGRVPNAFTDINGDQSSLIGLRNDYQAQIPQT